MHNRRVIFRCDASHDIGSGHVIRCLTLANFMKEQGWFCTFSVSEGTELIVPALSLAGHHITGPQGPFQEGKADIAIIDHYSLSAPDEIYYRQFAQRIVIVDDLADRVHDCDILLDQTYGRKAGDYNFLVPAQAVVLTGAEYAMLRPEFTAARLPALQRRDDMRGRVERVLVTLGGTDPHDTTSIIIEGLAQTGLDIDIVIGAASKHANTISARVEALADRGVSIRLHSNSSQMTELMAAADIAIGAGGTTSWERCCLGLPTILVELAHNQLTIAKNLERSGAIYNLGWFEYLTPEAVFKAIDHLKKNADRLYDMSRRAAQICDGKGVQRSYHRIVSES